MRVAQKIRMFNINKFIFLFITSVGLNACVSTFLNTKGNKIHEQILSNGNRLKIYYDRLPRQYETITILTLKNKEVYSRIDFLGYPEEYIIDKCVDSAKGLVLVQRIVTDTIRHRLKSFKYSFLENYQNESVFSTLTSISSDEKEVFEILASVLEKREYNIRFKRTDIERIIGWVAL